MTKVVFSEYFAEYKAGFSNGVIDFIINPQIQLNHSNLQLSTASFWDIGYFDAVSYYHDLARNDKRIDLTNIYAVISEFYIERIKQINEVFNANMPVFSLYLTPSNNKTKK